MTEKERRAVKRKTRDADERAEKAKVRVREKRGCRFPLCPCKHTREVSHQHHKGKGGDPSGRRSLSSLMVNLCEWRHRGSLYSIDRKGIRWTALTDAGADGPIAWEVCIRLASLEVVWVPFAVESAIVGRASGVYDWLLDSLVEALTAEAEQHFSR